MLAADTGRPLVQHVVDRCKQAKGIDRVIVAADHADIAEALKPYGTEVVLTRHDCRSGTERVADACERLRFGLVEHEGEGLTHLDGDGPVIINVQGDEPEIDPHVLEMIAYNLQNNSKWQMATAWVKFPVGLDVHDPNLVKVATTRSGGDCLWFSRCAIPYARGETPTYRLHLGIYGFRTRHLYALANHPQTDIERAESLEQLRAYECGYRIAGVESRWHRGGIDTPEQYAAFVARRARADRGEPVAAA